VESHFLVGVNIGVSQTQVGGATVDGKMIFEETFETPRDPETAVAQIKSFIRRHERDFPDRELVAVGFSVSGPTDVEGGRLLYAPHQGWRDVAIEKMLGLKVPVIVENNATAAAIYESQRRRRRGATKTAGDFVLVRAGTGIGVGLVVGGEVFRGATDIAGEVWHMTIVARGKSWPCGDLCCWERC